MKSSLSARAAIEDWIKAPGGANAEEAVKITTLWFTLLATGVAGLGLMTVALFMNPAIRNRSLLIGGTVVLASIATLFLARRFRSKQVGYCVMTIMMATLFVASWTGGGMMAPAAPAFLVTIALAGILLGARASIYVSIISFAACLGFVVSEYYGLLPEPAVTHTLLSRLSAFGVCVWCILSAQVINSWSMKASEKRLNQNEKERQIAEERLRESQEKFAAIFDNLNEAVFIHDPDTKQILDVNRRACEMYGYSKSDLRTVDHGLLSSGEPGYTMEDGIEWMRKARTEGPQAFEWHARHRSGILFWVEVNIRRDMIGRSESILVTLRDVTERKMLEERLRQTQKLEVFGQIAGGVAHDFNNVLVVILNNAQLLLDSTPRETASTAYLQEIADAGHRAAALTQQLLLFSRNEKAQLAPANFNLLVEDLTRILRRVIGENYDLVVQFCREELPVLADKIMLEQVLMNLVVNARDAMPSGGQISITTEKLQVDAPTGPWAGYPAGNYALLRVKDFGSGISSDVMQRLYEPFFTTKPAGKGTGLGLAVVLGIVKQHHGRISVSTELGKGSEFVVAIPFSTDQEAGPAPAPALVEPAGQPLGGIVLLVEDNEMVRKVAERALTLAGYSVRKADNAVEGLKVIESTTDRIELILSDVVMPGGMSGVEFADIVRIRWPETKVILMSGYNEEVNETEAAFLAKPFSAKQLLDLVKETLAK